MIGNFKVLGVFIANMQDEFHTEYLRCLQRGADEMKFRMIIYNAYTECSDETDARSALMATYHLIDFDQLDALIIMTAAFDEPQLLKALVAQGTRRKIPVITLDQEIPGCYSICNSLDAAFYKLIQHIIIKHKVMNTVFVAGAKGSIYSDNREQIYRKSVAELGAKGSASDDCIIYGDFYRGKVRDEISKYLTKNRQLAQAFICVNDVTANTVTEVLREYGYRVPEDTIVTGIDGSNRERYHMPNLTTCQLGLKEDAQKTLEILNELFCGRAIVKRHIVPHELVISESCGCVRPNPDSYGIKMEEIHGAYTKYMDNTKTIYELVTHATMDDSYEQFQSNMARYTLYSSSICLNEDFKERKQVAGSEYTMDDNPYTDQIIEFASKDRNSDFFCNEQFPFRQMSPRFEQQVQLKGATMISPVIFHNALYGYFILHCIKDFSETDLTYRWVRTYSHALSIMAKN